MGITFKNKSQSSPPVAEVSAKVEVAVPSVVGPYTILNALGEWPTKKFSEGTLMLVNNETGVSYQVVGYDPQTQRAKLKGQHGELLNPKVTEREAGLYSPVWR